MTATQSLGLIAFLFPLAFSPGPGNSYFAALGAARGLRGSLAALCGYHVATWLVTLGLGLGAGVALLNEPVALRLLGLLGGGYILWLGVAGLRSVPAGSTPVGAQPVEGNPSGAAGLMAGALLLLLNPKAYLIIAVMFSEFLSTQEHTPGRVVAITTIFTLNNLVAFALWALAGQALGRWAVRSGHQRLLDRGFAVGVMAVGAWLIAGTVTS
ncbi:MAG: LysE family transporter [Phycicoccus sp.]|nr:LysE family transporter [Phycicoccus sp.]